MALANTIAVRDRLILRHQAVVREPDRLRAALGGSARKNARLVRLAAEADRIGAAVARPGLPAARQSAGGP